MIHSPILAHDKSTCKHYALQPVDIDIQKGEGALHIEREWYVKKISGVSNLQINASTNSLSAVKANISKTTFPD